MRYALLLLLLVAPTTAFGAQLLVSTTPQHPQPGAEVTVRAQLTGAGQDVEYAWSVDDVPVASSGQGSISVVAPDAGEGLTISVSARRNGVQIEGSTFVLRPAGIRIEWEGAGTRPPFYTGRPLPTANGQAVAVAVPEFVTPEGGRVPAQNLFFTWQVNGQAVSGASGYGRDTLRVRPPFFNDPYVLTVTASTRSRSLTAEGSVRVVPQDPELVVYEFSPLAGLRDERAVRGTFAFTAEEVSFKAYPLFDEDPRSLNASWTLNGTPVTVETGDPFLAVFRKTGAGSGTYQIGISFSHAADFLRTAAASFNIAF